MADGERLDPFRGFKFVVLINDVRLGFQKVTGLNIGVETVEYREGTDINTMRKLPGLATFDNVTLERGVSDNVDLVNWMKQIVDLGNEAQLPPDNEFRREVSIQLQSRRGELVRTYRLAESFPVALNLGDMDAGSSDVIIETLELAHEGLSIDLAQSAFPPQT